MSDSVHIVSPIANGTRRASSRRRTTLATFGMSRSARSIVGSLLASIRAAMVVVALALVEQAVERAFARVDLKAEDLVRERDDGDVDDAPIALEHLERDVVAEPHVEDLGELRREHDALVRHDRLLRRPREDAPELRALGMADERHVAEARAHARAHGDHAQALGREHPGQVRDLARGVVRRGVAERDGEVVALRRLEEHRARTRRPRRSRSAK